MSDTPDYRTPGQLIADLLKENGWTQEVLSVVLGTDKTIINKIINGKRSVDAEMAIALSEVFNVDPEQFMGLQLQFDLAQARIVTRPDPRRAARANLFAGLPIPEMIKRGWLKAKSIKDMPEVDSALVDFFEADASEGIELLPHAAKKSNATESITDIQLAWLYRVRQIAKEMLAPLYTKAKLQTAIRKLSELRCATENTRHVPRILAEAGVRFVLVESLKNAKIDGVCFWLDNKSPVVGMSLRFDRVDNFWFVLRHELEHVLRGDGKSEIVVDCALEGENGGDGNNLAEQERRANNAAAEFCVCQKMLGKLVKSKAPTFSVRDLLGFSKMQNVHPGIVAGQLQRKTGRYELFRKYLAPVRKHLAPSSTVDGWGEIPPLD